MDVFKFSYECFIRLFVGVIGAIAGLSIISVNELIGFILGLSGMVYIVINGFRLITSIFKWFTVLNCSTFSIKVFLKTINPLFFLPYTLLLIWKSVLHFLKFSFVTMTLSLARTLLGSMFKHHLPIRTRTQYHFSSSSLYQKKEEEIGFIEGQIVFCENCGCILPNGSVYEQSNPLCHNCWHI